MALRCKLRLLQLRVRGHPGVLVLARELVHSEVEGVKAGEGDELELVAHRAELPLKARDGRVIEMLFPVEGRRTVVREKRVWKLLLDPFGELLCLREIGRRRFAPNNVCIRRVRKTTRDRRLAT